MLITHRSGFTIVEMLIVIAVIGILSTLGVVAYRGINNKGIETKTQSNLTKAQDFVETKDVSKGLYPPSLSGFSADSGVILTYIPSSDRKSYCLSARSSTSNAKSFKVSQEGKPLEGVCAEPPFDGPSGAYTADTCVPGQYAPDPRPYTRVSFEVEPKTLYPYLNFSVWVYGLNGSLLDEFHITNEPNDLNVPGTFTYGLGTGYEDAVELEIEAAYVKPNGSMSQANVANVPNDVVYQGSCSGYEE